MNVQTQDTPLSGQIVLVSGASRGFGFAVAQALGAAGAHVIALARTVGGLEELDEAIKAAGGSATLVPLDLTDDAGLERMGAALHDRWGRLDGWVHSAVSAPPRAPVEHVDAKDLDKALAINVRAFQRLVRVLDPLLRTAPRGRAVVCDDPGIAGQGFYGAYAASKGAQMTLARSWDLELSRASAARVLIAGLPPMPTATRARFFPGEDPATLVPVASVALRLTAALAAGQSGEIDLTED